MSKNQLSFQTILGMPNGSVGIFEDNLGGLSKFGKKIYGSKYYATDSGKSQKTPKKELRIAKTRMSEVIENDTF